MPTKTKTLQKPEGLSLIEELLTAKMKRLEIVGILTENNVPISSAYRWHSEAYKLHVWEHEPESKVNQALKDKELALNAIRDQLHAAMQSDDGDRVLKLSSELIKANKAARNF